MKFPAKEGDLMNTGRTALTLAMTAMPILIASSSLALSAELNGRVFAIDGDTLEMRIRLHGIDAPERTQLCRGGNGLPYPCGAKAKSALKDFVARRTIDCVQVDRDTYGRPVATCSVDGFDLGEWLVRSGLALDWPKHSKGRYDAAQREAQEAKRGMWAGSFVKPWLYRRCIKSGRQPGECSGNTNAHP